MIVVSFADPAKSFPALNLVKYLAKTLMGVSAVRSMVDTALRDTKIIYYLTGKLNQNLTTSRGSMDN